MFGFKHTFICFAIIVTYVSTTLSSEDITDIPSSEDLENTNCFDKYFPEFFKVTEKAVLECRGDVTRINLWQDVCARFVIGGEEKVTESDIERNKKEIEEWETKLCEKKCNCSQT